MTQRTRTQFSTLQPAQYGSSKRTRCEVPRVPGSVSLPAPEHQQTPWQRGGDAAWSWLLPDPDVSKGAMLSQRLPIPQPRRPEGANMRHTATAPIASITTSLATDHRRLSAHLDGWMRMLRQHLPGQQGTDEGQPERQARRCEHRDDVAGRSDGQAQRPLRPAARAALRGGGAGSSPQPAAGAGQQGRDAPAAAAPAGNGGPTRYGAESAPVWSVPSSLSLLDGMLCKGANGKSLCSSIMRAVTPRCYTAMSAITLSCMTQGVTTEVCPP